MLAAVSPRVGELGVGQKLPVCEAVQEREQVAALLPSLMASVGGFGSVACYAAEEVWRPRRRYSQAAGRAGAAADDGRCRRRRVPADAGTPGHVLGASVRVKTSDPARCTTGSIPEPIVERRLRALSRGPTRLRPTVGTARRPCGIVGAPLLVRVMCRGVGKTPLTTSAAGPRGQDLDRAWPVCKIPG